MKLTRVSARQQEWTRAVYQARYEFRCAGVPSVMEPYVHQPIVEGMADITHMRLVLLCAPLLKTLHELELLVGSIK